MDFLDYGEVSFRANTNIGRLCEDLNNLVGEGIWYDTFKIQNSKWFWFVYDILATMNSNKGFCGSFGLYPLFVACIRNSMKKFISMYCVMNS